MSATGSTAARETELKLALPAAALPALRARLARLGPARRVMLESVYFDTAGSLLARHAMALRVRRAGRRWLQTLKSGEARAAFARRGEWETPAPGGRLDLARFAGTPLAALRAAHGNPPLQPRFATRFERALRRVRFEGAHIEVALDRGEIVAGEGGAQRRAPLLELELELKSGPPRALFALALRLIGGGRRRALPLLPLTESKAARGYRLAAGEDPTPVKANARGFAAAVDPDGSVEQALRRVVAHGTEVWLANVHGVLSRDDPEFAHQARVALRRVRSALRLWREHADPPPFDDELRWAARALGALRDLDVLATETLPQLAGLVAPSHGAALARVTRTAAGRRDAARARARAALASGRCATLAVTLLQWGAAPAQRDRPRVRKVAARQLRKLHRRLQRAAQGFAALSAAQRHRVRILAKRLRYALDLLVPAVPEAAQARAAEHLARLQDVLGALNDAVVAQQALADLGAPPRLRAAVARAFAALEPARVREAQQLLAALARSARAWR